MTLSRQLLGQTGIEVSCLGLGTVKFGRNQEVKYPSSFSLPEDRQVVALLDQAKEAGINLIDTAPAYGASEQRLGRLLKGRNDWVICTKVGEEFTNGKSFYDFTAAHTRSSIERSLRNIGTDFLDIVLIHSDGRDEHILKATDCLETLRRMQEAGHIRAIGMSTKSVDGGLLAVELTDTVMVTYSLSVQDDGPVIDAAKLAGKGVMIKKALNSGHINSADSGASDKLSAADSLKFVLARDGVDTIIIGTINPAHLAANIRAVTD